jgi:nucleotide-binding universal stress UspA family protein
MFQHLVVPIDGSKASWSAVPIAVAMAGAVDGKVDVVTVVDQLGDVVPARGELEVGLRELGSMPIAPALHVLPNDSVAGAIAGHVEALTGAMVVMSSHGRGRSAAVLGSIADELLRLLFGPIIVVGPHVAVSEIALDGTYVVPLDGSPEGERILPIVESFMIEFAGSPWIVEVVDPDVQVTGDVIESGYPARLAYQMGAETGKTLNFEILHGEKPARAIVDFATNAGAVLIFASTHGRTAMARLRLGSVTADVVRHATCPVVLYRPPHLI